MTDTPMGKADVVALHRRIDALAAAINPIVTAHAASEAARADMLSAQVGLVTEMLALAQPAVRALGSRPKIWESNGNDAASSADRRATWRGLALTSPVKPSAHGEPAPTALTTGEIDIYPKGTYGGTHVFLREDGILVELVYTGAWHTQRDRQDEWLAAEREISTELFCHDWPAAADPKALAVRLLGYMDSAGNRHKATVKAREAAAKFRAIIALL